MMDILNQFFIVFVGYWQELWLTLVIGFLLSGVIYLFMPTSSVEKYLGKKGFKPIFISSFIGTMLPVCCLGSLPIAVTLKRKGASIGAVIAFLIATPATSVSALIVCWKLMGTVFTVIIFVSVIMMGILAGVLANRIKIDDIEHVEDAQEEEKKKCCCSKEESHQELKEEGIVKKIQKVLHYSFIVLPKNMGLEITLGIALASIILVIEPIQQFIHSYLTGVLGYIFIVLVGLVTYVCSTASVPMADAFLSSGMTNGQALCYLLIGPITSYGTILVIRKDFGFKVLNLYLSVICFFSLMVGIVFDLILKLF